MISPRSSKPGKVFVFLMAYPGQLYAIAASHVDVPGSVVVLVGVLFGPVVVGRIKANMAVIFPASRLAVSHNNALP